MSFETVTLNITDACATITLNRPERLNSFDMKLGEELHEVMQKVSFDDNIKLVILTGLGKGFCAGGDVKEMHKSEDKSQFLRDLTKSIHRCVLAMRSMEKPVIAAVNGAAFGAGFSLMLACDIIIADKKAKFGTAFIGIGLAPGCGTQLFTKLVGYQKACEYILTSKVFSAVEAEQLGIVNKIVDEDELDDEIKKYVDKFQHLPSIAVGKAKMLINKSLDNTMEQHLELESKTASYTAGTNDFTEGVTAFVEKRKPRFKGT
jgi:2-(1,2-epoxy-1,2-dihydrophenyl)acetyl-CoA isomerase